MFRYLMLYTLILLVNCYALPQSTIIPYRLVNNLIIVEASVQGQTGSMILDTGAPRMVLNSKYVKDQLGIPVKGIRSNLNNYQAGYVSITLGSLTFHGREAISTDLSAIEQQKGIRLLGMMDVSMLNPYTLHIDPSQQIITLQKHSKTNHLPILNSTNSSLAQIPFRKAAHLLVVETALNGKPIRLGIDTGSEVNIFHPNLLQNCQVLQELPSKKLMDINGATVRIVLAE